jgi:hypothetical protein
MTSGTIIEQRKIFLAEVYFSDNSGSKFRPLVIISNEEYNASSADVICCPITTVINSRGIIIDNKNLERGELPKKSMIKSQFPFTLSKSEIKLPKTDTKININVAQRVVMDIKQAISINQKMLDNIEVSKK